MALLSANLPPIILSLLFQSFELKIDFVYLFKYALSGIFRNINTFFKKNRFTHFMLFTFHLIKQALHACNKKEESPRFVKVYAKPTKSLCEKMILTLKGKRRKRSRKRSLSYAIQ